MEDFEPIDVLNEKYKKVSMTALRQFLSSVLKTIDNTKIDGYDIHHLDGNNKNSSVDNIVLLRHDLHSQISGNKNEEIVKSVLLDNAIKLKVDIEQIKLSPEDVDSIYDKLGSTTNEKELVTI